MSNSISLGDDHKFDPETTPLTQFPKIGIPFLQDGIQKGFIHRDKSEVNWRGHMVLTYKLVALGYLRQLREVAAGDAYRQKWVNRLIAEMRSTTTEWCFFNCKKYSIHYWLIANTSRYLGGYWKKDGELDPPLIGSTESLKTQFLRKSKEVATEVAKTLTPAITTGLWIGGGIIGGLILYNLSKKRK